MRNQALFWVVAFMMAVWAMFSVNVAHAEENTTKCIADTIYREAGGEEVQGMIAVGFTIMTRVDLGFAETPCQVVNQRRGDICQYEFRCLKRLPPIDLKLYLAAWQLAERILAGALSDPSHGATWYNRYDIKPAWMQGMIKAGELVQSARIGRHTFWRLSARSIKIGVRY